MSLIRWFLHAMHITAKKGHVLVNNLKVLANFGVEARKMVGCWKILGVKESNLSILLARTHLLALFIYLVYGDIFLAVNLCTSTNGASRICLYN